MATIHVSSLVGAAAMWAGMLASMPVQAQYDQHYLFTTVTVQSSTYGEQARYLNDANLVAGRTGTFGKSISGSAQIWDASGTGAPVLLWKEPSMYAPGGPIAGSMVADINSTATLFPHMVERITSQEPVVNLSASAFNDQGLVVGTKHELVDGVGWQSLAKWADSPSGTAKPISVEGNQLLQLAEVNNVGQAVGTGSFNSQTQAFVFDTSLSQGYRLFGDAPDVVSSEVWDINDAGQILGKKTLSSGVSGAFLFNTADGTFLDLPSSSNPASPAQDGALNNLGQIVFGNLFFDGQSWIDLRQSNGFTGDVTGLDINNHGQILLSHYYYTGAYSTAGTPLSNNYNRDFLILTTVPEPASVLSMGLGGLALVVAVRRHRGRPAA